MSLLGIIILLLVIALILGFAQKSGYFEQGVLNIIYGVIVLFLVIMFMRHFGVWPQDVKI